MHPSTARPRLPWVGKGAGGMRLSAVGVKHEEGVEQPREIKELRK